MSRKAELKSHTPPPSAAMIGWVNVGAPFDGIVMTETANSEWELQDPPKIDGRYRLPMMKWLESMATTVGSPNHC